MRKTLPCHIRRYLLLVRTNYHCLYVTLSSVGLNNKLWLNSELCWLWCWTLLVVMLNSAGCGAELCWLWWWTLLVVMMNSTGCDAELCWLWCRTLLVVMMNSAGCDDELCWLWCWTLLVVMLNSAGCDAELCWLWCRTLLAVIDELCWLWCWTLLAVGFFQLWYFNAVLVAFHSVYLSCAAHIACGSYLDIAFTMTYATAFLVCSQDKLCCPLQVSSCQCCHLVTMTWCHNSRQSQPPYWCYKSQPP